MVLVKLGFRGLAVPATIQRARGIINGLTNNPDFPAPNPTLADFKDAVDNLETAYEDASDGGKAKTALVRTTEKKLHELIVLEAAYVQQASGGDENKILSTGFGTRAAKTPPQDMEAPQGLAATLGSNEGETKLKWKPVKKSKAYLIQSGPDGSTGWAEAGTSTKSSYTATGLVSGSRNWFRICAIGPKGKGPWSDPAKGFAG